ncbi:hypothetical protein O181_124255 [Austropuccinia psidii MF-1]|uniref:Uncharacterized protein n=1 Tax=Austropuccinia psidii MF-1 TaxID=1389203 RepID=A0A9Q3Q500_9BASI|nr:hypothetical protein [Austropuccinia psidii MF-1]
MSWIWFSKGIVTNHPDSQPRCPWVSLASAQDRTCHLSTSLRGRCSNTACKSMTLHMQRHLDVARKSLSLPGVTVAKTAVKKATTAVPFPSPVMTLPSHTTSIHFHPPLVISLGLTEASTTPSNVSRLTQFYHFSLFSSPILFLRQQLISIINQLSSYFTLMELCTCSKCVLHTFNRPNGPTHGRFLSTRNKQKHQDNDWQ